MTLEEKVAQMFVLQVYGTSADTTDPTAVAANQKLWGVDNPQQLIAKYHPGGIIYYAADPPNLVSPQQVAHLSNGIQQAAMHTRVPIPATITTDQEQGSIVTRVPAPFTQFPGAQALGAARSPQDAYTTSKITGQELKAIGITQDYAPDSDVNVNPANPVIGVRSPGSDPSLVAQIAPAEVDGYQAAGIIATAKHFPGHGDTDTDSHTGVPIINHTKEQWEKLDLPPFKADIAHGVDSIMTAHIIVPALDPSMDPATLSKPILTGILRDQLHYKGVIVTDALGMAGLRAKYGDDRIPVLAVKAGVDQLEKPPADDTGKGLYALQRDSLINAVKSGEISEARIDQSVYRILAQKLDHGLFQHPYVDESKVASRVGTPAHLAAEQRITDKTTTLVKNDALPLKKTGQKIFVTGYGVVTTQTLAADIAKRGAVTSVYQTGTTPSQATINQSVAQAQNNDVTVVTTNAAWNSTAQQNLVKALVATGKPVIVASVRDAYDIGYFTDVKNYLVTYGYTPASLESLTKVLFGEIKPKGKLPVMIPVAGHPDQTLYPYGYGLSFGK
ncbi:glycoside hydrolase family 3 protein [Actinomadura sp. DC4]|uniref:glycoside hydrolase family 3 protein n=1 Tax=Actinomadura sp. DC4 TaxID=3055069 RepID=UPI0025B1445C|nr:glycoside hydrolase family 3 protein [Actinomadura sp. DC4]MDN3355566.1 glycoside hydrolase family 3 protein [Actinomadura sp. DC4]